MVGVKIRDVLVALGFFLVGSAMYRLDLYQLWGSRHDVALSTRMLVLGLASCGLLLRRTRPEIGLGVVALAVGVDMALGSSVPVVMALIDLVHLVTLNGSRRVSRFIVGATAVLTVGSAVVAGVWMRDWRMSLLAAMQVFTLLVVPVWWAMNVRQHRESAEQVTRIAELDRRAAVSAERNRMARDLHDVIAGHLSAIAIQSAAALSRDDPELVRTVLKSVRENSVRSLAEMRTMIDVLRTDDEHDEPASARISDVARLVDSARAGGLRVELSGAELPDLPIAVDVAAYRIVQESLTNALKHAPGARTEVGLAREGGRLVVTVSNEARGGQVGTGGTGLVSMAERAQAVGGTFEAGRVGGRWRVRAELPA